MVSSALNQEYNAIVEALHEVYNPDASTQLTEEQLNEGLRTFVQRNREKLETYYSELLDKAKSFKSSIQDQLNDPALLEEARHVYRALASEGVNHNTIRQLHSLGQKLPPFQIGKNITEDDIDQALDVIEDNAIGEAAGKIARGAARGAGRAAKAVKGAADDVAHEAGGYFWVVVMILMFFLFVGFLIGNIPNPFGAPLGSDFGLDQALSMGFNFGGIAGIVTLGIYVIVGAVIFLAFLAALGALEGGGEE